MLHAGNITRHDHRTKTSLYYYRARYYDGSSGRFTSEDPITFKGGTDFYRYTSNRPVNLIDPFGLNPLAPSIPWPWPWFPPGSVLGGAGRAIGLAGRAITIAVTGILELTILAEATNSRDDVVPKPKECDKRKQECEKEWAEAYEMCRQLLAMPHPPRGLTSGYNDLANCARGLVSEECGGNPVSRGKK